MHNRTAAGARAPLSNSFRPELVYMRPARTCKSPQDEVQSFKSELAKVKGELRELKLATQQFVRSML